MLDLQNILARRPLGLAFDIDGTLSPIAPTPQDARLYPGIANALAEARKYAHVAIMTGRAVTSGAAMVNVEGLVYVGSHGLEWSDGLPTTHAIQISEEAQAFVASSHKLLDLAQQHLAELPGVFVERKHIGGSVHYRLAPDREQTRQFIVNLLTEPAREHHFALGEGKQVVDIKPISNINKGSALRSFVQRFHLQGVLFAGDDRTDLDAMREIKRLREEGLSALAIGVQSADTFPEILTSADMVVQEVAGMAALLDTIVAQLRAGTEMPNH